MPARVNAAPRPASNAPAPAPTSAGSLIPQTRVDMTSTLRPELKEEVDRIAQRDEEKLRRSGPPARPGPGGLRGPSTVPAAAPSARGLEISRAPSPTEARPLRAIPVPEEFVPLPPRNWSPNRKYWAAAATCHLPLYFQDASLERYGHSTEQFFGPIGRYLTFPLDDPRQSNQRNQITQPFFSIGLFAAQMALLPYNMVVDPPWEAEYDLGYYRPGDLVPNDVYYLPIFGVGPPLHGSHY
jgi:hypothetical protein